MKRFKFTIMFKGGNIEVRAFNYTEAKILAQAEAIKRGCNIGLARLRKI